VPEPPAGQLYGRRGGVPRHDSVRAPEQGFGQQPGSAARFEHPPEPSARQAGEQQTALAPLVEPGVESPRVVRPRVQLVEVRGAGRRCPNRLDDERLIVPREVGQHVRRQDGFVARLVGERCVLADVLIDGGPLGLLIDRREGDATQRGPG
jgi:hypothetical protein